MFLYGGILSYFLTFGSLLKNKSKVLLILFMGVLCILTIGRSYSVGKDTRTYVEIFRWFRYEGEHLAPFSWAEIINGRMEWGYQWVNQTISNYSDNPRWVIVFCGFVLYLAGIYFISRNSNNYLMSIMLFVLLYFPAGMNVMRQMVAVGFLMFSYQALKKNKLCPFLFFIFMAILFHKSAMLFAFLWFIRNMRFTRIRAILVTIMAFITAYSFNLVYAVVQKISSAYDYYESVIANGQVKTAAIVQVFVIGGLFLICIMVRKKWTNNGGEHVDKKSDLDLYVVLIAFAMSIVALGFTGVDRVVLFFEMSLIIAVPNAIQTISNSRYRLIISIILYEFILVDFFFVLAFRPEWTGINNYFWGI